MYTSSFHPTPQDGHQSLSGAHKAVSTIAALLSLAALITHHAGLVVLIVASTLLVKVVIQRITEPSETGTPAHLSGMLTERHIVDGGSFPAAEMENPSPHTRQAVVVMDGGTK